MKRLFAIILAASFAVSFCACRTTPVKEPENSAASTETQAISETEETQAPSLSVKQRPMYTVCLPSITEKDEAEDGTTLFLYTYQNITLVGPEPEVADKIIIDFLSRVDESSSAAASLREKANEAYAPGAEWTHPYLCDITFQPERIDSSVLSLYASYVTYADTPRPEATFYSVNYDLLTGDCLSLTDILTDKAAVNTLCQQVIDKLDEAAVKNLLYEGFQETVEDRLTKTTDYDHAWHLSEDGLVFYFEPYEIAPYTSGVIEAVLPYNSLAGILKDAYFPAEADKDTGSVYIKPFDENSTAEFSQFSEVVLEQKGLKFLLYTDTSVSNIKLYQGTWSGSNISYQAESIVFAGSSLTPGDAIMLEAEFTDTYHPITLSYDSNGETILRYLSYNQEENTVDILDHDEYLSAHS